MKKTSITFSRWIMSLSIIALMGCASQAEKSEKAQDREQKRAQIAQALEKLYPKEKAITINSEPAGAKVIANGQVICESTPCTVMLPLTYYNDPEKTAGRRTRKVIAKALISPLWAIASSSDPGKEAAKSNQTEFTFIKDGYVQGKEIYKPIVSRQTLTTQTVNGEVQRSYWDFNYPDGVFHMFGKQTAYVKDPTIRASAGEATNVVSRDNPGGTALERTTIRWYFDSDPRGARISMRVISSVPDIVKNTNETYLTTTPYEETRSFNILGLTYENSRDVTVEVKVSRKGYFDQVKRYNVRQAIDQQEISGFFDLVKNDDSQ